MTPMREVVKKRSDSRKKEEDNRAQDESCLLKIETTLISLNPLNFVKRQLLSSELLPFSYLISNETPLDFLYDVLFLQ